MLTSTPATRTAKLARARFGKGSKFPLTLLSVFNLARFAEMFREPRTKGSARAVRRSENTVRAAQGMAALEAYAKVVDSENEDVVTMFRDLLIDLRHLADALGVSTDDVRVKCMARYVEEITEY